MERKKVTIKGIENDAWETLRQIRSIEQRMVGVIVSDAINAYWEQYYETE